LTPPPPKTEELEEEMGPLGPTEGGEVPNNGEATPQKELGAPAEEGAPTPQEGKNKEPPSHEGEPPVKIGESESEGGEPEISQSPLPPPSETPTEEGRESSPQRDLLGGEKLSPPGWK